MTEDPYTEVVRQLFADTAHAGLAGGCSARSAGQGVEVELSADVVAGQLDTLRFRARGCPHLIAACELLCSELEGSSTAALREPRTSDIMRRLSVPVEKTGRILVLEDAVALLADRIEA